MSLNHHTRPFGRSGIGGSSSHDLTRLARCTTGTAYSQADDGHLLEADAVFERLEAKAAEIEASGRATE